MASLTTIATPHHGAEIADLLAEREFIYLEPVASALRALGELYGDRNPDLYAVLNQLTSKEMADFNLEVVMDERVYYQSIYSVMNRSSDDVLFRFTYLYIYFISGANDGLVSERSAIWGNNYRRITDRGISHAQIVDLSKRRVNGVDVPSLYIDIVRDLAAKGF